MKWVLVVVGSIVVLIAVVALVGLVLPRDHVAAMATRVAARPEAVWAALTTPSAFPQWRSDVARVEEVATSAGAHSWREHSRHGALTMETQAFEPPHRLVTRIADTGLPYGGTWEFRLDPDGTGATRVTVIERGSVYNPVFRFVSRFVMGHTATIETYLRDLGRHFGTETTPAIVGITDDHHGL